MVHINLKFLESIDTLDSLTMLDNEFLDLYTVYGSSRGRLNQSSKQEMSCRLFWTRGSTTPLSPTQKPRVVPGGNYPGHLTPHESNSTPTLQI